jgi:hypothetical protein
MKRNQRICGLRKRAVVCLMGTSFAFPLGLLENCNIADFQTTSTVTLSTRDVASYLVRGLILTPIETVINTGLDYVFDRFADNDNEG